MIEAATQDDVVFSGVCRCIGRATGLTAAEISLEKTLIADMKIDSIDMIDLIYQLEDEFSIEIKIGEMEKTARSRLGDKPFAVDNVITPDGILILQDMMPEIPKDKFFAGIMVQQIPYLFTVDSMCRLVESKLRPA
jgi:acyl carrier protein